MIRFDTGELAALGADLDRISHRTVPAMVKVFEDGATDLERKWAANARQTSGAHGKHYPASIDHERLFTADIAFEVGPNPSKPQGNMSFEYGSVNQPPHLDGQRATDEIIPALGRRVDDALNGIGL